MVLAITDALVAGERDFMRLQQTAIDAFGGNHLPKALDRRQRIRLVSVTDDHLASPSRDGMREK
jgi:hypothetical protein